MLALFCFIIGSINSIYYVAYDSFYPLLISEGNYSKAYSIASVLETLSALIIPIATYFYNLFGIAPLLGINALCFFIAATAETQIRAEEHYIEKQRAALALEEQHSSGRQLLRDIKEGFRYLMSEKGLLRVAIYFTFSMLASGASQASRCRTSSRHSITVNTSICSSGAWRSSAAPSAAAFIIKSSCLCSISIPLP